MTQTSRLVIEIDSTAAQRNADLFNAELQRMTTGGQRAASSIDHLGNEANSTAKELDATSKAVRSLVGYIGGMAAVSKAIALADEYSQMASRIRNATDSAAEYNLVQERLLQTANNTYRPLKEAQEVFLGTADTLKDLGYTTNQALDVADSLSYAFVINATESDKAATALDNYSKSMITGKVSSDAFIAITGAADNIVNDLAAHTGKTAAEIKKLGIEGKISLTDLNETLRLTKDQNLELAQAMSTSVADGFQALTNSISAFLGKSNEAYGVTGTLAAGLGELATHLDFIANTGASLAVGYLTKTIIASTVAGYEKGKELLAQRAATIAQAQANTQLTATEVARTAATVAGIQADIALAEAHALTLTGTQRLAYTESTLIPLRNALTAATTANTAAEVANTEARIAQTAASSRSAAAMAGMSAILGGPAGLIGLGVGLAAAFYLIGNNSKNASVSINGQIASVNDLAEAYLKLNDEQKQLKLSQTIDELDNLNDRLNGSSDRLDRFSRSLGLLATDEQRTAIKQYVKEIEVGGKTAETAFDRLNAKKVLTPQQLDQAAKLGDEFKKTKSLVDLAKQAIEIYTGKVDASTVAAKASADAIKNQGNAAQTAAGQFEDATKAYAKFIQSQNSNIYKQTFIASAVDNGVSRDNAELLAQYYEMARAAGQVKDGITYLTDAQRKQYEISTKANDTIRSQLKAESDALKDRNKQESESVRLAKQQQKERQNDYTNLIESTRTESEVISEKYRKANELLGEFAKGNKDVYTKIQAMASEESVKQQVEHAQKLAGYNDLYLTEIEIVKKSYAEKRSLARVDRELSDSERIDALKSLEDQEKREIRAIELADQQKLLAAQSYYSQTTEYMSASFQATREEIELTKNKSKEYIEALKLASVQNFVRGNVGLGDERLRTATYYQSRTGASGQMDDLVDEKAKLLFEAQERLNIIKEAENTSQAERLEAQKTFEEEKFSIQQEFALKAAGLQVQLAEEQRAAFINVLGAASGVFGDLASLAEESTGRASAAYKLFFAVSKAASIAQAVVNTEEAATKALTLGPILGVPAASLIRGLGYASVGIMAGQSIATLAGQAHDGWDYLPKTGTYNLEKGERVVSAQQNQDLTSYLKIGTRVDNAIAAQSRSSGSGGNVYVYNNTSSAVSTQKDDSGNTYITIDDVRKEIDSYVPAQLARPNSSISKGLKRNYNTETRR